MQRAYWLAALMLSAPWSCAAAQTTSPPAAVAAPTPPPPPPTTPAALPTQADSVVLPAGTVVAIALAEQLTSKTAARGQKFAIQLAAPITVDGRLVAPAGASGLGEVVYAEAAKGGGAPGKLVLAARYVDVGKLRVPLKAFQLSSSGENEYTKMYVAAQLIGPAVMFMNGQEVVYPAGVRANAKVAQDVVFPPPPDAAPPAPQAAPTPAAAQTQPSAPVPEPVK